MPSDPPNRDRSQRDNAENAPARRSANNITPNSPPGGLNGEMAPASMPEPHAGKAPVDHSTEPGVLPDR
jgi:hypothetical protein